MKFRILFMVLMVMLLVLGLSKESRSQLTVNTGSAISMTPLQFVQTYLVGTGVTISNATYNGSADPLNSTNRTPLQYRDQVGSFTTSGGALTQLGIGGGVILSTGYVAKAIAPASPSDDMEGNNAPFESDPDLHILANSDINDKSVLEFDFIPVTNVITFKYVFSSKYQTLVVRIINFSKISPKLSVNTTSSGISTFFDLFNVSITMFFIICSINSPTILTILFFYIKKKDKFV